MLDNTPTEETLRLAAERLRLEREALEIERERFKSAQARAKDDAQFNLKQHSNINYILIVLVGLLGFTVGILTGVTVMENRQQRDREARITKALSQIGNLSPNDVSVNTNRVGVGEHKKVEVLVIQ